MRAAIQATALPRNVFRKPQANHRNSASSAGIGFSKTQAARTELRNLPTSRLSRSLSPDKDFAAPST